MSEVPADDEHEDDDAIEGKVVPFPGVTLPAAVPVKPQRGQPGEWKPIVPEHLRTARGAARPQAGITAGQGITRSITVPARPCG
jgi:hypothetical protein